jgi:recombinational DNA repair protein RecT
MTDEKGKFTRPETAVAKRDAGEALMAVTGYAPEILTVLRTILPPAIAADMTMIAAYAVTCQRLGVDPLGGGVYPTNMRGRFVPILHYNTMRGVAERSGLVKSINQACVYDGEAFTFDPINNAITHTTDHVKRTGKPVGAWCRVETTEGNAVAVYVAFADVARGESDAWKSYPADMVEKCAVRRALSKACPALFAGVYTEDEVDIKKNTFVRDELPRIEDEPPTVTVNAEDTAADLFGDAR